MAKMRPGNIRASSMRAACNTEMTTKKAICQSRRGFGRLRRIQRKIVRSKKGENDHISSLSAQLPASSRRPPAIRPTSM